jgi:hypothetical protein
MKLRKKLWISTAALAILCGYACKANAQAVYAEDFNDETLSPNTTLVNAVVATGFATFTDPVTARATFAVVQDFNSVPVQTFSFATKAPITQGPGTMELVLRVGQGTGASTLQNADQIAEVIAFRNGNRGAFTNSGDETLFLITNNQETAVTFTSPVDNTTEVMLNGFQQAAYVKNNVTGVFGVMNNPRSFSDANTAANPGFGVFERFAIGSSSTGHDGTWAMDDVLVKPGVTFDRTMPDAGTPGDVDGDDDVDMDDFAIIQSHFQQPVAAREEGDLTFDLFVDFRDFRQWKANFPFTPPPSSAAGGAVPEPSVVMLAGLALAAGIAAKRRRVSIR